MGQEFRYKLAGFFVKGFHRLQSKVSAWTMVLSELKILFQAHVVADRIHFLIAVEFRVACFSKTPAEGTFLTSKLF